MPPVLPAPSGRPAVRLPVFEGPLDLLLHLVRTHRLDIRDIPIARVTEQYLEYLALMEALDLDIAGEFLVMAATLMEIKSRLLLPRPVPPVDPDDGAEEGMDPRAELIARLLEYERFQQVAEELRALAAETQRSFPRPVAESWQGAVPLVKLRPGDLLEALRRMQPEEAEEKSGAAPLRVRRHAVNLRQRMAEVLRRVAAAGEPLPFSALAARAGRRLPRREVLLTFLAVLELVRLEQLSAWQQAALGEIYLTVRPTAPEPAGSA